MANTRTMVRVPLAGPADGGRVVAIELGATKGATIGVNLYLADGSLVRLEDILNPPSTGSAYALTLWSLVGEIPPNILALAALTGSGFAYRNADGSWRLRKIGREVIGFSFGDATPEVVYTAPVDLLVVKARVIVLTAFDGAGAAVKLGTLADDDALFPATAVDLSTVGSYEFMPDIRLLPSDDAQITITPGAGATAGTARLVFDSIPMEGI